MKDPAFLFYSGDFLSGTMLMNNEEIGIYIKLLCIEHQTGHLKKEDMQSLGANEKVFSKFKIDENNHYYNERLETEISKRKAYSESRRKNREKKEICKTYEKDMNNICGTYVEHMENENEIINTNETVIKDKRKRGSKEKKEEEKIHFAEFVTMTNAEYDKLVSTHGKEFADQCVTVLDNYKGASGKKYQSDYRAILNWVVDRVKADSFKKKQSTQASGNPFFDILREEGKM